MDWVEAVAGVVCGAALFAWGHYFYARPNRLRRYWHDSNRVLVTLTKLLGGLVMFVGALLAPGMLLLKLGRLESWIGLCLPLFALLCTILFRPIRNKKPSWQEFERRKAS